MSSNKSLIKKYNKEENVKAEEVLKKTLLKKAKGFVVEEIVEEFGFNEDGKMVLTKKKVTTKEIAPDSNAIKYLLELENLNSNRFSNMTDEELKQEKIKLLNLIKGEEESET